MNWKLIFVLSLFGLAMAVATISWIPSSIEPIFWLLIFLFCAYRIATNAPGKYFLHGLMVGLVNCVWVTAAHILFSESYLANHAREAEQYTKMNEQMGVSATTAMFIIGPIVGIISGLILGLFSFIAAKIVKKKKVQA